MGVVMDIIVASSNLFRRELSSFILSEAGYTVHEVSDIAALKQSLDHVRPAMILLDMRLGSTSSEEITRYIRQRDNKVLILVLTNKSSLLGSVSLATHIGDAHLDWPYQADDLLARVRHLLRRFSSTSSSAQFSSAHPG
jgi:DNA-binding response OmpR family regulator